MPNLRPWLDVKARFEAGDRTVTPAMREMAESVLEEKFVRRSRANRPDARDRAAGDDSFNDDDRDGGMVVL